MEQLPNEKKIKIDYELIHLVRLLNNLKYTVLEKIMEFDKNG